MGQLRRPSRRLRVRYHMYDPESATIETPNGWYVCEVSRCVDEGRRKFRRRVRALQFALELFPNALLTTSPEED